MEEFDQTSSGYQGACWFCESSHRLEKKIVLGDPVWVMTEHAPDGKRCGGSGQPCMVVFAPDLREKLEARRKSR